MLFYNHLFSMYTVCTHFLKVNFTSFFLLQLNGSQPRGVPNMQKPTRKDNSLEAGFAEGFFL